MEQGKIKPGMSEKEVLEMLGAIIRKQVGPKEKGANDSTEVETA